MSRLTDHVVVLDRAMPTEFREHHEYEERTRPPNPLEVAARMSEAGLTAADLPGLDPNHPVLDSVVERVYTAPVQATRAELHHEGGGRFAEVAYGCGCGHKLTREPNLLAAEWARHAARETGMSAEVLAGHVLASIRGTPVAAVCSCGQRFFAREEDPTDPGAAIAAWAAHVEALV